MLTERADHDPLILTVLFDPRTQERLETLRRTHFPPALNRVPAHMTLFHNLPGADINTVLADLAARRAVAPFPLVFDGVRFLGRGVALTASAPPLGALRADLARRWASWLTAQDRQGFRAHVTIQNKVIADTARSLYDTLRAGFMSFEARVEGLRLWHYRGGFWHPAACVRFDASAGDASA